MVAGLDKLVHAVVAPKEPPPRLAELIGSTPTNQQIVDAAKAAYAANQNAVDALTVAVVRSAIDPSLAEALATLDGTNWSGSGISSDIVTPFLVSDEMRSVYATLDGSSLATISVGVFDRHLPESPPAPGMIGFAAPTNDDGRRTGLILSLNIPAEIVSVGAKNLQYGLFVGQPTALHDAVTGMYVTTTLEGVSVALKILLDASLATYGFVASTGTTLPLTQAVFAGATSQWADA